jgi:hypothetical protein
LGLNNARARPALRQKLPGDSSHQTRGGQNGDIGLLANGSLAFVEVPEVGQATDRNPSGLDEGPAALIFSMDVGRRMIVRNTFER